MPDLRADYPEKSYPNYDDFICSHCQKIYKTAIKNHEDLCRLFANKELGITEDQITVSGVRIADVLDALVTLYGFVSVQRGSIEMPSDLPRYFGDQRHQDETE